MSAVDLRAWIGRLCALAEEHDAKAMPGPWVRCDGQSGSYVRSASATITGWGCVEQEDDNAAFIARARTGWPDLAKAARALLVENERLRAVVQSIADLDDVVRDGLECFLCSANDGYFGPRGEHEEDCPVAMAKAALGASQ